MKKTWKERLYDISCSQFAVRYIPILPFTLAILSIVCCFIFVMLFDWRLLATILYYMFWLLPGIGWLFHFLFGAVRSYNKETFCCNNIKNSLLADETIAYLGLISMLLIPLWVVANIIFDVGSREFRITFVIATISIAVLSFVISKSISKHFKKKIVYIEPENK